MMLRSSSTPILGSLLSSYSESPSHNHNHNHHPSDFNSPKHQQLPRKLSLNHQTCPLNLITPSSHNSFTSSPSINAETRTTGFRRVQSEGNLDSLVSDSFTNFEDFNNHHSTLNNKFMRKPNYSILETIPSFSGHGKRSCDYDDDDEEAEKEEEVEKDVEEVEGEMGKSDAFVKSKGSVYGNEVEIMGNEFVASKMHLALGLGAMAGGFNGGDGGDSQKETVLGGDDGDGAGSVEEYYRRMMEENPGNPLFLRNYAQFLHQSKDLGRAEEYYSRAILMDPGDGEILSKYAQLTWELHHDHDRASSYFQRSVQAAPQDSHVLAAYAGFLWEAEDEEADSHMCTNHTVHHDGTLAAAAT